MQPTRTVCAALAAMALTAACLPAAALDIRVKGTAAPAAKGPIPPKARTGHPDTVAVVSGAVGGTEFRLADEMASAVASGQEGGPNGETALRVFAIPGGGGLQNVRDVLSRPDLDFGIAPAILLDRAAATPEMSNLRSRVDVVAPLHVEEVHLVAGAGVADAKALAGKRVSVGPEGSATELVAREVLKALGAVAVESNMADRQALDALRAGGLDAAFIVSGKPVGALGGAVPGLRFLPLPADAVPEGFVPSELTHADYPGMVPEGPPVRTWGTQAVLFGYAWPASSPRGQVGRLFLSILMYRLPELQVGASHPKWREVNVASTLPGWRRLPAMQSWLSKAKPRASGPADEAEFEAFLRRTGTTVSDGNRDALYRDFLRWRNNPVAGGTR